MDSKSPANEHWQTALDWITREHESALAGVPLAEHAELAAWLAASPDHRAAYAEASRVWLLTGLVPPSED